MGVLSLIFFVLWLILSVDQEPADTQQTFLGEHMPTIWQIIPSLEFLIKHWETMAGQPCYQELREAIMEGVQNFKKSYWKVDKTSDMYFICLGSSPLHLFTSFCLTLSSS
jgi:hypothetical protein